MADECEENGWLSILPEVFDLLLRKPENIVDDTSIEKLLAFISTVCSSAKGRQTFLQHVSMFFSNDLILVNCTTISFALRVCGILWSSDSSLFLEYPSWFGLFAKCREREGLWCEAIVRDAYFTGLQSLTGFHEGLLILHENQELLRTAAECISMDTSIFVASNARLLIAKFLISSASCETHVPEKDLNMKDWLIESFHQTLHQATKSCDDRIAVLDVIRMMMEINVLIGQELLERSKLLICILDLADNAEEEVCGKIVEMISEIELKYSKDETPVVWDRLLCCNTTENSNTAADKMLKIILALFQRGMIVDSLNLVCVLACSKDKRSFPSCWLSVLCNLISTPLCVFEDRVTPDNSLMTNGIDSNPINRDILATDLISYTIDSIAEYEVVRDMLRELIKPWLTSRSSKTLSLHQLLLSMTHIVNKACNIPIFAVTQWVDFSLKVLSSSLNQEQHLCVDIQGNDKVIKASVVGLTVLVKYLLTSTDLSNVTTTNHFFQTLEAYVSLGRSSQTTPTVIICTLGSIGELLEHGSFILNTSYQDTTEGNVSTPIDPKRPRMDNSYQNVIENLGFMLRLRLRDQRWEVKDSALEFVTHLVKLRTGFSISLVEQHALTLIWDAIDDCHDSYVRSSVWQALAHVVDDEHLWTVLKENRKLTEINVITKMDHTSEHEDEAFPRRSVIDCIHMWIRNRNPIVAILLPEPQGIGSRLDASQVVEVTTLFSSIIRRAFDDFDWEVKVRALLVLQATVDNFNVSKPSEMSRDTITGNHDSRRCHATNQLLNALHKVGALVPLLKACGDCDNLVCEKALSVIGSLQNCICFHPDNDVIETGLRHQDHDVIESGLRHQDHDVIESGSRDIKSFGPIATVEQLLEAMEPTDDLSTEKFKDLINRVETEELVSRCRATDYNVRCNPVCLLEDILASVRDDTENLLDCY